MKKSILMILIATIAVACSSGQGNVRGASGDTDPKIVQWNETLKQARMFGFKAWKAAPGKAAYAEWEKSDIPIVKSVVAEIPEGYVVEVRGHADTQGATKANQKIGLKRAEFVYEALTKSGVDKDKLVYRSMGESNPIMDETNTENPLNRRVSFVVLKKP